MKTLVILSVLQTLLQTIATQTLQSDITMTVSAAEAQPVTYNGSLCIRDELFRIDIMGMNAAYDGTTLYMYQAETDEMTLSNPQREELIQVNPMMLIKSVIPHFNATEKQAKNGTETIITLTPKSIDANSGATTNSTYTATDNMLSSVRGITVRVRNTDTIPLSLEIRENNLTSSLTFVNALYTDNQPAFVLKADDYKDAYINDLR